MGATEAAAAPEGETLVGSERGWIFGLLIAPYGVLLQGIVQGGVLGYLLSREGAGSATQAHLIGLLSLPTSMYFLWSPLTDFFVRRRTWLLVSALIAAFLIWLSFEQPRLASTGAVALALLAACCSQLIVSSAGRMMGALHSERTRRVASSLLQAGAMGFGGLSAWVLIYLSARLSRDSHVAWINGLLGGLLIAAGAGMMSLIRTRIRQPKLAGKYPGALHAAGGRLGR